MAEPGVGLRGVVGQAPVEARRVPGVQQGHQDALGLRGLPQPLDEHLQLLVQGQTGDDGQAGFMERPQLPELPDRRFVQPGVLDG
ncbi:MAG: hypothetical protein HYT85_08740, partial [candidate division NC10 bacterium]|nr:hypothetical protein [candidate division NC10 bacterium]